MDSHSLTAIFSIILLVVMSAYFSATETAYTSMDVVVVPTNKPMVRQDMPDAIFATEKGKYHAIIEKIIQAHAGNGRGYRGRDRSG
jgi:Preprotein translocase subunit SecA (ATPase, RNA helicase)